MRIFLHLTAIIGISLLSISNSKSQSLNNTSWSVVGANLTTVSFRSDTFYLGNTAFSTYIDTNNSYTVVDLSLASGCNNYTGNYTYSLNTTQDTLLFNLINDSCSGRVNLYDASVFVRLATTIKETNLMDGINIFPNPVSNRINIHSKILNEVNSIQLLNSVGQIVNDDFDSSSNKQYDLDVPNGIYFLRIQFRDGTEGTKKIIKI